MTTTTKLLDHWKTAHGITSDNQAAMRLRIKRATISKWRTDGKNGEAHVIEQLATELGRDPAPYILAAAAERTTKLIERQALMRAAKKLGFAAALLLGVAVNSAKGNSIPVYNSTITGGLYIMSNILDRLRRLARNLTRQNLQLNTEAAA